MIEPKKLTEIYLEGINPKSVLDIGCGEHAISLRFAKKGIKVTGVDKREIKISEKILSLFQKILKNLSSKKNMI